ncbi:exocyst complex subunit 8 [Cavenderia fasciculata]|uniref:Exocyst complex subunit 8 n=1 Tax=Cavenderia fasciculata TaxID=261658 RepID=F4QCR4_CACFS|nr:exocyst complex subunit 8 [Cavenderia fasciculata]EGG13646.1 exocyst complex subunit 8 [Cavenderia fasciculata]|eukprot:XP_004350350.1 exocyst complex subunit 8 [Cavenderia fasciculata]
MKKGGIYDLKFDPKLSTASSNVEYQNVECADIRSNGIYVIKFMYREWVGPITMMVTQKSSIKLSVDFKEGTVTCLHTDKKKTVYRYDIYQGTEQSRPGGAMTDEENPVNYETFTDHSFSSDKYTNDLFVHKSDSQAMTHLNYLNERKLGCIDHLKKDVYKNHLIFIGASKEIASSEVDMLDFRNLVTEYGNSINAMQNLSINWDFYKAKRNQKVDAETLNAATEPIQWLTTAPYELDTAVEQREFDLAIYENNPKVEIVMQTHPLKEQIDIRIKNLIESLMDQLRSPILKPNQIRDTIALLVKLEQSDKAKSIFLESRSHAIQVAVKKVSLSGDLIRYIGELTRIIFNAINTTCLDYTNSFPESYMASGLVEWIVHQVELIVDIFSRQVLTNDNYHIISQLIHIVHSHCEMMEQSGLALSFYWTQMLQPHIEKLVYDYEARIREQLQQHLGDEKWQSTSNWEYELALSPLPTTSSPKSNSKPNTPPLSYSPQLRNQQYNNATGGEESKLKLTESTIFLNTIIQRFSNDICHIINPQLIPTISTSLSKIFREYLNHLIVAVQKDLSDNQMHSIISDAVFISEDLFVRSTNRFEDAIGRPLNNLDSLKETLDNMFRRIRDEYSVKKALETVDHIMMWDSEIYRLDEDIEPLPKKFIRLAETVEKIVMILSRRMQELNESEGYSYGNGGLQHFVLEMRYLSTVAGKYPMEEITFELINTMIENAVKLYAKEHSFNPDTVLRSDEFFTQIIDNIVYQKSVYK